MFGLSINWSILDVVIPYPVNARNVWSEAQKTNPTNDFVSSTISSKNYPPQFFWEKHTELGGQFDSIPRRLWEEDSWWDVFDYLETNNSAERQQADEPPSDADRFTERQQYAMIHSLFCNEYEKLQPDSLGCRYIHDWDRFERESPDTVSARNRCSKQPIEPWDFPTLISHNDYDPCVGITLAIVQKLTCLKTGRTSSRSTGTLSALHLMRRPTKGILPHA